jgi:hypothetical protein
MKSFTICTFHQVLFGSSNQTGWGHRERGTHGKDETHKILIRQSECKKQLAILGCKCEEIIKSVS